jgi:hypothetical protein
MVLRKRRRSAEDAARPRSAEPRGSSFRYHRSCTDSQNKKSVGLTPDGLVPIMCAGVLLAIDFEISIWRVDYARRLRD